MLKSVLLPMLLATAGALALAVSGVSSPVMAAACPATPTCTTPDGTSWNLTDPGDGNQFGAPPLLPDSDNADLTFLAVFNPSNQNPDTITTAVDQFLTAKGLSGGQYFGRTDGSGTGSGGNVPGASFTTTSANGGLTGTFTFNPGNSGTTAGFISLHAGGGQSDVLLEIDACCTTGGPFAWDTSENLVGSGNSGAISNFDLFSGHPVPAPAIGHGLLVLLAVGGVLFGGKLLENLIKSIVIYTPHDTAWVILVSAASTRAGANGLSAASRYSV
jgi:hypothetical protein